MFKLRRTSRFSIKMRRENYTTFRACNAAPRYDMSTDQTLAKSFESDALKIQTFLVGDTRHCSVWHPHTLITLNI